MGKKLSLYLTFSTLNVHKIFLYFFVILETTDTSQSLFVQALVNFEATSILINRSFVERHYLNICQFSKLIPVYKKTGQISKVVNIIP